MVEVVKSRRLRSTPFTPGVEAAGVKGYSVYNHMLLPTHFESVEADYHHLKRHVQIWDVSCERQVSVKGPDAKRLVTMLSPRDLSKMKPDQCFYIPVIDARGGMLNDPVLIRHSDDHYWFSIADYDYLLYVLGVADALGLDVEVEEPDVFPLAVQGPKADDLMERIFGETVRDIGFFRYKRLPVEGKEMIVARSGYSRQGGFEIYVDGADYGLPLWNQLMAAGEDLEVRAGGPNGPERIEGGLLSCRNDYTTDHSPHETGLSKYITSPEDYLGKAALAARPVDKMIRPVTIDGEIPPLEAAWPLYAGDQSAGYVTSAAASSDFGCNIAIATVDRAFWDPGTQLRVDTGGRVLNARVEPKFWV